jgi:hypothetical protein
MADPIVAGVKAMMRERYPVWMGEVVEPYLTGLRSSVGELDYSLLLGETQQGKTLVMHMIMWLMRHEKGCELVMMTKNLDSLRQDAIGKLNAGSVNEMVMEVCGGDRVRAAPYMLGGCAGLNYVVGGREVPVYLMQPDNNMKMMKMMKGRGRMFVVIDEVHEMYSMGEYLTMGGLSVEGSVTNHVMLHLLAEHCREGGMSMMGVTATPQRTFLDPEVHPGRLYRIPCVAPVAGLKRIGYGAGDTFGGAEFCVGDEIDAVRDILARKRVRLSNGNEEIPFLNVSTDRKTEEMREIMEGLREEFGELVHVRLFVQTEEKESNVQNLDSFFELGGIPEKVIREGVVVLIGRGREAAGITMRPSLGVQGRHAKEVGGRGYEIHGITDFVCRLPGNMETAEQLVGRATGWYDKEHVVKFWLEGESAKEDVERGMLETKRGMVEEYAKEMSPKSVTQVKNLCTGIRHLTPNQDYYMMRSDGMMVHRNAHQIANWVLSMGHEVAMERMREVAALPKRPTLYQLFVKYHKDRGLNGMRPKEENYSRWIAGRWNDCKGHGMYGRLLEEYRMRPELDGVSVTIGVILGLVTGPRTPAPVLVQAAPVQVSKGKLRFKKK